MGSERRQNVTMTPHAFRRLALAQAGAVEGAHMRHPDFRAGGRIFASLASDGRRGMVKLPPPEQERFLRAYPQCFAPAPGAWGRQGCTMVELAQAEAALVREALQLAHLWATAPPAARRRPGRRA